MHSKSQINAEWHSDEIEATSIISQGSRIQNQDSVTVQQGVASGRKQEMKPTMHCLNGFHKVSASREANRGGALVLALKS